MDCAKVVYDVTKNLGLLDTRDQLVPLDSLTVLDLVAELERVAKTTIPTDAVTASAFESLASITTLLSETIARDGRGAEASSVSETA